MKLLIVVSADGTIGAGTRFLKQAFIEHGLIGFPWATLTVNVVGGFLTGLAYVLVTEQLEGSPEWRTFLATGMLGGLTTFSAFSLDMMHLLTDGISGLLRRLVYVAVSVTAAPLAGIWLTRTVL